MGKVNFKFKVRTKKPRKGRDYDPSKEYVVKMASGKWAIKKYHTKPKKQTAYQRFVTEFLRYNDEQGIKLGKDVIAVNLNGRGVWHEFDNDNTIPYGIVSPYTAIVCAYYLGCRRIGMLGVDFTPNHYNRKDGDHNQTHRLEKINEEFSCLESDLFVRRCTLVNLSPDSEIHSVTKMGIEDFLKN